MLGHFKNILFLSILMFCTCGLNAQVFIGDGVLIHDNTQITIVDKDVIIATDEIKGEGEIKILNSSIQKITVLKNVETNAKLKIVAETIDMDGKFAKGFATHYLPPLTSEIIASIKKEEATQTLPIRYINTEGKVFPIEEEEESAPNIVQSLPLDSDTGNSISEVNRIQLADLQNDYIIPIYSNRFNDERISGSAELYEFECLTAILKPPIT